MSRLTTRPIASAEDLVRHFDRIAPDYEDTHGRARSLLRYRLSIIERLLGPEQPDGTLLEIGCGKAIHLIALAARFGRAVGADVSAQMLEGARRSAQASAWGDRIELRVDPAECLATVEDASVDAVLCVGALEHMLDKPGALAQVRRVVKVGGRFVCLTPNGDYCWYRALAPRLGLDTRHLSTDRFLTATELQALIRRAGIEPQRLERWRFIPKGDLPPIWGHALHGLDLVGQVAGGGALRGGLAVLARRTR
jgi:2-polyprenyl-6-hydroxyphenyl methylase/3-demethylubiquinone-9 3-methyltransferase